MATCCVTPRRVARRRRGWLSSLGQPSGRRGMSRLIAEILDHARLRGIATLVGAAEPVERTTPYYALRTIFRDLIGDSIDAVRRSLVDDPGAEATLEPLLPLLNPVLGLALPDSDLTRIM